MERKKVEELSPKETNVSIRAVGTGCAFVQLAQTYNVPALDLDNKDRDCNKGHDQCCKSSGRAGPWKKFQSKTPRLGLRKSETKRMVTFRPRTESQA